MKKLLTILCLFLLCASVAWGANTHGLRSNQREMQAWFADAFAGYVPVGGGCLPTVPGSGLTLSAFACNAYVKNATTGEILYVTQPAVTVTIADATPTWLAIHQDSSTAVSGWTRQTATHYLYKQSATQPANPDGGLVIVKLTVAASNITVVEDYRDFKPFRADVPYIMPTWLGAVCDGSTEDTTAIQNTFVLGAALQKGVIWPGAGATCITDALSISSDDSPSSVPPWIDGNDVTLKAVSGATGDFITIERPHLGTGVNSFRFENFLLDGNDEAGIDDGIRFHGGTDMHISNIEIHNMTDDCFDFDAESGYGVQDSVFVNLRAGGGGNLGCGGDGFQATSPTTNRVTHNAFLGLFAVSNEGHGFHVVRGNVQVYGYHAASNDGMAIYVDNTNGSTFFATLIENNHQDKADGDAGDATDDCFLHCTANSSNAQVIGGRVNGDVCDASGTADTSVCTNGGEWISPSSGTYGPSVDSQNLLYSRGHIGIGNNQAYQITDAGGTAQNAVTVDTGDDMTVGNTNYDDLLFSVGGVASAVRIRQTTGNLGIGVNASHKIHIEGGAGYGDIKLDGATGGCLMFRDTDDAGWSECTLLNGTMTCTTDADGVCDGS